MHPVIAAMRRIHRAFPRQLIFLIVASLNMMHSKGRFARSIACKRTVSGFQGIMSASIRCSNTDVKAKGLVAGTLAQHLHVALFNLSHSKEITADIVRSVFDRLCRACSIPLPSTLLDSQPLEKGGLDIEGNF